MKKTLAIVLALVMVLCMVPAMSAHSTVQETITDKSYSLKVWTADDLTLIGSADKANAVTAKYNYEEVDAVTTGKWSDDTKMAIVEVVGFKFDKANVESITIDGKNLDVDSYADYKNSVKAVNSDQINFPVELTKAGYSDTYVVTVVSKVADADGVEKVTTETAKISVKFVNTASYKDAKTATITNIAGVNDNMSAYIVGSKIYFDFIDGTDLATAKITFADENGKAFSAITYAYNPVVKQADGSYKVDATVASTVGAVETKLDKSAAKFDFAKDTAATLKFELETKNALYETKAYTVKMRANIKPEDPKGIYFAETSKTIAMGETYAPVVMGVKTGKVVAATINVGSKTDKEVIDIVDNKVVGTREGVAYITASYTVPGVGGKSYTSSSMKITVTLPGESIPAVGTEATVYYVTCRNLNVRAGAGTSYKKTGMVHRGDAVKVVEIKNGWAKLADNTYVCAKYIAK